VQILNVFTFLFAIKLSIDVLQGLNISTTYMKMIFKLIILSVALARTGFILPGVKEITCKNV
jgi:hypothetical protein